ncbi:DUF835 domain-containing protein [Thermococcus argininiproducens]|uniref:DUF835 domain-containing protein n=1 Tax=Thermococcus argininiproducens TaxID=2866384 RepID=A0A9E7M979_9EURY|nr:DUF835 domain-containing protein [Thermococcus argininiproducens]USG99746.1 DUF835 domain-containing protein [Thermococcus argininiproducens]
MDFIPYINFISRWLLFLAVTYKALKSKEKRWGLIATALFINALDIESYILEPLGVGIKPGAYEITSQLPGFLMATFLVWGGIQLKKERSEFKDVAYLGFFAVAAYIWIFLSATDFFDRFSHSFTIKLSFPYLAFGFSLIYIGYILRSYVVAKKSLEELFPWGLALLGAINLTYPVTRNIEWLVPIAFLLAAIFRFIAAVGALKFAIFPAKMAVFERPQKEHPTEIKGIFLFNSKKELKRNLPTFFSENVIMITRNPPKIDDLDNVLVYWLTKIESDTIKQDGKIYPISPAKIDILIDLLTRNLESGYNAIYVDGFEYLVVENGFESAAKFLFGLRDRVMSNDKALAVVLDPRTLDDRQMALLERELRLQ